MLFSSHLPCHQPTHQSPESQIIKSHKSNYISPPLYYTFIYIYKLLYLSKPLSSLAWITARDSWLVSALPVLCQSLSNIEFQQNLILIRTKPKAFLLAWNSQHNSALDKSLTSYPATLYLKQLTSLCSFSHILFLYLIKYFDLLLWAKFI